MPKSSLLTKQSYLDNMADMVRIYVSQFRDEWEELQAMGYETESKKLNQALDNLQSALDEFCPSNKRMGRGA